MGRFLFFLKILVMEMGDHFTLNYNVKVNPTYKMFNYLYLIYSLQKMKCEF